MSAAPGHGRRLASRDASRGRGNFAAALADALQSHDLTLERIANRLAELGTPVSIATLSYWQSGRSAPTRRRSIEAVAHLEGVLDLPQGSLTSRLPQAEDADDSSHVFGSMPQLDDVLDSFGFDREGKGVTVSLHDLHIVRPALDPATGRPLPGKVTSNNVVRHVQRMTKPTSRLAFVYQNGGPEPPESHIISGGTVARQYVDHDNARIVGVFDLDRTYQRGELAHTVTEVDWGISDAATSTWTGRMLATTARLLSLCVRFEVDPPAWARLCQREVYDGPVVSSRELSIVDGEVQAVVTNAPPGVFTIEWAPLG